MTGLPRSSGESRQPPLRDQANFMAIIDNSDMTAPPASFRLAATQDTRS